MNNLNRLLHCCYGEDAGDLLCSKVDKLLASLEPAKGHGDAMWHRNTILYVTYPDSFDSSSGRGDLFSLAREVPRIARLGCTAIHVLPFLSSPRIDAGFDVSDYLSIRQELGGVDGLQVFLDQCHRHAIRPFMDIILNHVSERHSWLSSALAGDTEKRAFFISRDSRPPFSGTYQNSSGVWAVYNEPDKEYHVRVIFPEHVGEVPHWKQYSDGRWYYHTFYPQQVDLNFCNPAVFLEFAKILIHWAGLGFSFRLDAIEFIGKDSYFEGVREDSVNFAIVEAFRELVSLVHPQSVFLVEASQVTSEVRPYFHGSIRERRAELAYNFQLSKALFYALLGGNVDAIWKRLDEASKETNGASWITFLRTHDELSFEFALPQEIELLRTKLATSGLPFREDYGRSGRLMSLLGDSTKRHCGALFLMCSLPGQILLYYGDEYGAQDDIDFMKQRTKEKNNGGSLSTVYEDDTRDIHRAPIDTSATTDAHTDEIYAVVERLLSARKQFSEISTVFPTRIVTNNLNSTVFAAKYVLSEHTLIVLLNMGEHEVTFSLAHLHLPRHPSPKLSVGTVGISDDTLTLGSFGGIWLAV